MSVYELNRDQLNQLKQDMVFEAIDCPSYGEIADAENIPDEDVFEKYAGTTFSEDDFFCSVSS